MCSLQIDIIVQQFLATIFSSSRTVLYPLYIEDQKHIPNFLDIWCIFDRQNFSFGGLFKTAVLFCKSSISKMVSVKTNKDKNRTPLLKTNFSWLETLSLCPKRFLHSKGPKYAICLWLRLEKLRGSTQSRFDSV